MCIRGSHSSSNHPATWSSNWSSPLWRQSGSWLNCIVNISSTCITFIFHTRNFLFGIQKHTIVFFPHQKVEYGHNVRVFVRRAHGREWENGWLCTLKWTNELLNKSILEKSLNWKPWEFCVKVCSFCCMSQKVSRLVTDGQTDYCNPRVHAPSVNNL